MEITFLVKGFLIGSSMMLAIGPIALLCISRTIEKGIPAGIAIGLGAATADGIYGFIAAFGLTLITNTLTEYEIWIKLIGSIFLLYLGGTIFLSKPTKRKLEMKKAGLLKNYITTLFLTLTSPMTILIFMTVFAGLGVGNGNYLNSSMVVIGVFLGSAIFYLLLSSLVGIFRTKMTEKHLIWGNRLSGIIIGGFGIATIISFI